MREVGFYHCTRRPAAEVAVQLTAKVHEGGERLLLLADPPLLEDVDRLLWTLVPESFLPHAMAGGARDAEQPVLLSRPPVAEAANGARYLMLVGVPLPESLDIYQRVFALFDAGTPAQDAARQDWRRLADTPGVRRSYWQQTAGGWKRGWKEGGT